jgi:hypothetical protein
LATLLWGFRQKSGGICSFFGPTGYFRGSHGGLQGREILGKGPLFGGLLGRFRRFGTPISAGHSEDRQNLFDPRRSSEFTRGWPAPVPSAVAWDPRPCLRKGWESHGS